MAKKRIYFACTCGESMMAICGDPDDVERIEAVWFKKHSGEGHEPCDSKMVRKIRARKMRERIANGKH